MAEYIDRENIIPHSIDDDYEEGGERLIVDYKDIEEMSPADVIERSKIDKAIEEITKLRNSCNRMITEETTLVNYCYEQYANCYDECLKIVEQNIGE